MGFIAEHFLRVNLPQVLGRKVPKVLEEVDSCCSVLWTAHSCLSAIDRIKPNRLTPPNIIVSASSALIHCSLETFARGWPVPGSSRETSENLANRLQFNQPCQISFFGTGCGVNRGRDLLTS